MEVTWQAPRAAGGQESGAAQRYVLEVHLRRRSGPRGAAASRAYTPRFPKVRLCLCTCAVLLSESSEPDKSVSESLPAGCCRTFGDGWSRYDMGTQMYKQPPCGACLTCLARGIVCTPMEEAPGTDCGEAFNR